MREYNQLRIKYCKVCAVKQCDSCSIGKKIEALTREKNRIFRADEKTVHFKMTAVKKAIEDACAEQGMKLIDAGYITVEYEGKNYQVSTNKLCKGFEF